MKRTGPTNDNVRRLIMELRRVGYVEGSPLWKRVAYDLELPRRGQRVVNLSRLQRLVKDNETIIVPGKVLGTGDLLAKVKVAALGFSKSAQDRIQQAKGSCLSIEQLLKENPKGQNVRLIG